MSDLTIRSKHCWLDCLATLPDCDVSDLCSEVHLVSKEGDTTTVPTIVLLATSNLFRLLHRQESGEKLIFPDVANIHLEQTVDLLTSGCSERAGRRHLSKVGGDLQQVQHVMDILVTGVEVNLANITPYTKVDESNKNPDRNNNPTQDQECRRNPAKKNKYSRRELKRLISTPVKAGNPRFLSSSFSCKFCQKDFVNLNSLRTHTKNKHPESTFACMLCDLRFIYQLNLKKHVISKHSPPETLPDSSSIPPPGVGEDLSQNKNKSKCPLCSKFVGSKYMKIHIEGVHKGLRYECGECNFISSTRARVKKHCSDSSHPADTIRQVFVSPSKVKEHWTLRDGQ